MSYPSSDGKRRTDRIESDGGAVPAQTGVRSPQRTGEVSTSGTPVICVVGLGYVGLPLAVHFSQATGRVIGYDVDGDKIDALDRDADPTGDVSESALADAEITYTSSPEMIARADIVLVTVPTPIDEHDQPNLEYVESAAQTVGAHMRPGATVVLESTVYPGATREIFIPTLEAASGLSSPAEFGVGYSPERISPGDTTRGIEDVVKIVSGQTEDIREELATLYESIVEAGVYRAPSIEVAEAAKVVENVQRDLNIAFVNDLAMAFDRMDAELDTSEVLEAAGTKWNFHAYSPGLVGGHCIPVDPHFFSQCSKRAGFVPELMLRGRQVNESMPEHVAHLTIKALNANDKTLRNSRVRLLGLTYKADVADVRTSKAGDVAHHLEQFEIDVQGYDPVGDVSTMREVFDFPVTEDVSDWDFDALVAVTGHSAFRHLDLRDVATRMRADPVLVDIAGVFDPETAAAAGMAYRRL